MSSKKRLLVLISEGVTDRAQSVNQTRALSLLSARGIPHETLDGMDPANRERRNELFGISGVRANYPQLFLLNEEGKAEFWGGWDRLEGVNEASGLPLEVLRANPEVETWDTAFHSVVASFD
mmetsp:Transcript_10594/g.22195  ORF Transcript_10594/g.22195 Transcript_10594/m.22195 type:complete len:122 (-) Transcript_10594:469-834(-)|eukprot:CAMPEP_0183302966 /NCGR_PEP_ID=MMETSP0160_2-20130417/8569_1 /TAXON_ID=2839 ORGANISM="Odontella Sinensis, Strain Grunow 1884" /NCGR_SAMPLE_ID=MMETSP0160_2 /ASSEMBLY_ACC=CAM_ASM_000250 /LENGTH=121 /DNA_ID=CAMNT_0025465811 /DNA_START=225 /DNA_END=590 /DNA_ORIENTATION=-